MKNNIALNHSDRFFKTLKMGMFELFWKCRDIKDILNRVHTPINAAQSSYGASCDRMPLIGRLKYYYIVISFIPKRH